MEEIDLLESSEKWADEAENAIKKYKSLKTAHAKNRMRPQLAYLIQRLKFERKELKKLMGEGYGNDFGETSGGY